MSAATCAALCAVTRSLITLSKRYGTTPTGAPVAAWQPAFLDRLSAADRRIRRHAGSSAAPTAADELIGDAARFLTVAQDLLATHLAIPDPPRSFARTPEGSELLDAPVRQHLLRRAADLTDRVAELTRTVVRFDDLPRERPNRMDVYRPREKDLAAAARDLAEAAAQCPETSTARLELSSAPVLATPVDYPQPDEAPGFAAERIRTGLERLATAAYRAANRLNTGEHPPVHTAGNLRAAATSFAVAHALAADLLTRLAPRLPSTPDLDIVEAADLLRAAGAAWAKLPPVLVRTASVPDSGPRSPLTVQANSAAIRLGRLLYADPTWTPRVGPGRVRALDDLLAPDVLDALCVTISALPRSAAVLASNYARLISDGVLDLYSADRTHRPEGEGRHYYPLQPAQRDGLVAGYGCHSAAERRRHATVRHHGRDRGRMAGDRRRDHEGKRRHRLRRLRRRPGLPAPERDGDGSVLQRGGSRRPAIAAHPSVLMPFRLKILDGPASGLGSDRQWAGFSRSCWRRLRSPLTTPAACVLARELPAGLFACLVWQGSEPHEQHHRECVEQCGSVQRYIRGRVRRWPCHSPCEHRLPCRACERPRCPERRAPRAADARLPALDLRVSGRPHDPLREPECPAGKQQQRPHRRRTAVVEPIAIVAGPRSEHGDAQPGQAAGDQYSGGRGQQEEVETEGLGALAQVGRQR
ncbi:hypothetical protein [Actinocrinis puniceicyclus]|uniref:hypothetical protein n=1 Tax=Actinocrinis puniceicyclus TaxID=977794 RepID=UPI001B8C3F3C|nr:hypothetical protein [Actinocrinis puniceicyclus]